MPEQRTIHSRVWNVLPDSYMPIERTLHIHALRDAISPLFSPSLMQWTQRTSRQSSVPRHLFCELQDGRGFHHFQTEKPGLSSPSLCSASTTQAESYMGDTSWRSSVLRDWLFRSGLNHLLMSYIAMSHIWRAILEKAFLPLSLQ